MELIHSDADMRELGFIDSFTKFDACVSLDCEVEDNSWQISMPVECYRESPVEVGEFVFIEHTEWGGEVEQVRHNSHNRTVEISGLCWRGMLLRMEIKPPEGQTHLDLTAQDGNEVISSLINGRRSDIFTVSETSCPMNYSHSFRYVTLLDGITDTLAEYGCRLGVNFAGGKAMLRAEPVADRSDEIEFSDDWNGSMISRRGCLGGCNHILALGSGEQLERDVVNLWLLPDGSITDDPNAEGIPEGNAVKTYLYDFSAAESRANLVAYAKRKLKEFSPLPTLEFEPGGEAFELELGDVVGARDGLLNFAQKSCITKKLLSVDSDGIHMKYSVKPV